MQRFVKIREGSLGDGYTRWLDVEDVVVPGPPGPPSALQDDPDPTLAANLKLNNHGMIGQLETETLVIDGGLL